MMAYSPLLFLVKEERVVVEGKSHQVRPQNPPLSTKLLQYSLVHCELQQGAVAIEYL